MLYSSKGKNNFFWYFLVPILVFITFFISLSPWLLELLATPPTQVFSGINRWSPDYFTYLSYVELGRRGQIAAQLLITTTPQKPVIAHLAHTASGLIFGNFLGLSSVASYHFARSLYGLIFVCSTLFFFYKISRSKLITLTAFIFTFYISGFAHLITLWPLKFSRFVDWMAELNVIGRPTVPIHYTVGFIFFTLAFSWYFFKNKPSGVKTVVFGLLLNLILLANPFAFLIISLAFIIYWGLAFIFSFDKILFFKKEGLFIIGGFLAALPLFLYTNHFLSMKPWGLIGTAPKFYQIAHPPIPVYDTLMAIGPMFFLGIAGILAIALKIIKIPFSRSTFIFLVSWLIGQFFLLFFGDQIKLDPLRSIHGLFYLPLSLFSAYLVVAVSKHFGKTLDYVKITLLLLVVIFLTTLPNYILSYRDLLYAFTDFRSFAPLSFPYKKQVEAFKFLESSTPVGSGVLAMFEASSLIPGFSGNSTESEIPYEKKVKFYSNQMDQNESLNFLKENHFDYVYQGYQEKYYGEGNMNKLPFLKKIFQNEDVSIYKIL